MRRIIPSWSPAVGAALLISMSAHIGHAATTSVELAAGGLSFAANPSIILERQDLVISPDTITVTYALRNTSTSTQALVVTFALPELDANAVADSELVLPTDTPTNYVQFQPRVDGQAVAFGVEQRATALGLDITDTLKRVGIPLFPFGTGAAAKLTELVDADRIDLLERGALKEDGTSIVASWTLKTVAHWRQAITAGQTITITQAYRPIVGTAGLQPDSLQVHRKRSCVTPAFETALAQLPSEGGVGPLLTSVGFMATVGADNLGPARRYRLIIETSDRLMIAATCRDGLKRTGPMQFEWTTSDHVPDEDLHVLFAR